MSRATCVHARKSSGVRPFRYAPSASRRLWTPAVHSADHQTSVWCRGLRGASERRRGKALSAALQRSVMNFSYAGGEGEDLWSVLVDVGAERWPVRSVFDDPLSCGVKCTT